MEQSQIECKQCIYYDDTGKCRLNPPVLNAHTEQFVWPKVNADDWCSHWQYAKRFEIVIVDPKKDSEL